VNRDCVGAFCAAKLFREEFEVVQAALNRAEIVGRIEAVDDAAHAPGFAQLLLRVDEVTAAPGFANAFAWAKGQILPVLVPQDRTAALSLKPGLTLRCLVEKAGPRRNYAHSGSLTIVT
jgi:hypothetical protein